MRFLHVADLHIGKRVHERLMFDEQEHAFEQLVDIARREAVDAVLVAGDVFDRTNPIAAALELAERFFAVFVQMNMPVFVIPGNHDSAQQVAYCSTITAAAGLHMARPYRGVVETHVLRDDAGEVCIHLLPFVRPLDVRAAFPARADEVKTHHDAVRVALEEHAKAFGDAALGNASPCGLPVGDAALGNASPCGLPSGDPAPKAAAPGSPPAGNSASEGPAPDGSPTGGTSLDGTIGRGRRHVLVAHQFVTAQGVDPERCESETNATVGGIDNVDAGLFAAYHYVALGHLHGPQRVGRDGVRYAGSPVRYSFSEIRQKKAACIVDLDGAGNVSVRQIPLTPLREMREITCSLAALEAGEDAGNHQDYMHVTLTDRSAYDAFNRVKALYPNLLLLSWQEAEIDSSSGKMTLSDMKRKSCFELFADFFQEQTGDVLSEEEHTIAQEIIAGEEVRS